MARNEKGLTPKAEAFCWEYPKDRCGKRAAERAGYAKGCAAKQASILLKREDIRARIEEIEAGRHQAELITKNDILAALWRTAEEAKQEGKHSAAVRAYELLGREKGMFKDEDAARNSGDHTVRVVLEPLDE